MLYIALYTLISISLFLHHKLLSTVWKLFKMNTSFNITINVKNRRSFQCSSTFFQIAKL